MTIFFAFSESEVLRSDHPFFNNHLYTSSSIILPSPTAFLCPSLSAVNYCFKLLRLAELKNENMSMLVYFVMRFLSGWRVTQNTRFA